jgi:hypothetical protein
LLDGTAWKGAVTAPDYHQIGWTDQAKMSAGDTIGCASNANAARINCVQGPSTRLVRSFSYDRRAFVDIYRVSRWCIVRARLRIVGARVFGPR